MTAPTMWIDIDDLVQYLLHHDRPSGIQRVAFEICQALHQQQYGGGRVGFVRRGTDPRDFVTVRWDRVDAAFRVISSARPRPIAAARALPVRATNPEPALATSADIPQGVGRILRQTLALQARVVLHLARLSWVIAVVAMHRLRHRLAFRATRNGRERADAQHGISEGVPLREVAAPGDSFVVLGSPWDHRDYARIVRWVRDERRMRFAVLIYDLVPLRRPEWCDRGVILSFTAWYKSVLPLADQIFTISRATADDVVAWATENGLVLHNPVQPVPMGTGLNHAQRPGSPATDAPPTHLPAPGSYVLFVSTLEARKNHALLFRVWRRLLAEMPPDQVPTLVFAGRVGWLVADLMQQLENAAWLNGKIRLVRNPTDTELMALYSGCRFTLFPSLFEGWGLPVSESLALGRPCIASNRTSLPEAGGDLARYFDPENLDEACHVIRQVIEDPVGLEVWRDQVAREFRMVPWSDSAEIIRRTLAKLDGG